MTGSESEIPETVAVVGGGAVGTTAAYDLARDGAEVTLFEAGDIASGSTGRASGICYDAFAEDVDAAVAQRALERFRAFDGQGDFELSPWPYVWLAREGDEKRAEAIREQVPRMQKHGRNVELADLETLDSEFPDLNLDDVAVAAVAHDAAHVIPPTYPPLLAEKAAEAGATVRTNTTVELSTDPTGVVVDGEVQEFDAVLVAAGAHSKQLLARVDIPIAMKPYRVQALTASDELEIPICYDATGGFYLRPHPDGLLAGDGTEEVESDPDDWNRDADDWFVSDVSAGVEHRAGCSPDVERAWAGLCTATPDHDPLLGELRDGLYVATGFQGHGFMRSPALGEAIAAQIRGGEGIEPFDPTRFDGDEEFEIVEGMDVE
ncbi:FAD-binding oxidoreductase [Haloarchaeobius sp. HME9146]|uniref:NAD(P)/FAD-dependent oxidoreductase n=1 Tax=Haloarchaeobius sp. HME9146 TaxID=2978732 RepID=UPI0021C0B19A|nr:FAD-binding oxidoreductase [Haloarchaeobius sp. HME9146]MCT9095810.1 FAD-binding oxidoreductase [Haloarchaeobius sp. HME9146]